MNNSLVEKWNRSHSKIPSNKSESNYAVENEKLFPRNSDVLDLGGGSGADAIYFLNHGHKVVLADISDTAIDRAKEKATGESVNLETVQISLGEQALPFTANSFDIVYSRLAIHYFNPDETISILKNIYNVLKESGTAYLTVKSPADKEEMDFLLSTSKQTSENVFEENGDIKSRYSIKQWEKFLSDARIKHFEVKEYVEDLSGKIDTVKSGNSKFILNQIVIQKP